MSNKQEFTWQKPNIWDKAARLKIFRRPPKHAFYAEEQIDPGVNYFVLMLEQLGAIPHFSCEGHPNNFYVLFESSMELAEQIRQCGYFTVELEGINLWSIRIQHKIIIDADRKHFLRLAAAQWENKLEPLNLDAARKAAAKRRKERQKKKPSASAH